MASISHFPALLGMSFLRFGGGGGGFVLGAVQSQCVRQALSLSYLRRARQNDDTLR